MHCCSACIVWGPCCYCVTIPTNATTSSGSSSSGGGCTWSSLVKHIPFSPQDNVGFHVHGVFVIHAVHVHGMNIVTTHGLNATTAMYSWLGCSPSSSSSSSSSEGCVF
jgi:hypothetical protein